MRTSASIDYDLWLRISVDYPMHYIPEPLANYRIWEGQMSKKTGERLDNFFRLLERFLDENPGCVSPMEKDRAWAHTFVTRGLWHAKNGRKVEALKDYRRAMSHRFFDARLWLCVADLANNRS